MKHERTPIPCVLYTGLFVSSPPAEEKGVKRVMRRHRISIGGLIFASCGILAAPVREGSREKRWGKGMELEAGT